MLGVRCANVKKRESRSRRLLRRLPLARLAAHPNPAGATEPGRPLGPQGGFTGGARHPSWTFQSIATSDDVKSRRAKEAERCPPVKVFIPSPPPPDVPAILSMTKGVQLPRGPRSLQPAW